MRILHDTYKNNYLDSTTTTVSNNNNIEDDFFAFSFGFSNTHKDEINEYLSKPVEHYKTDPLLWWKVTKNKTINI